MSVLIISRPDPLRNSLKALLMAIPSIGAIHQADDLPAALRALTEHYPALVLLDINLPGESLSTLLKWLKANEPQSRRLVLADTVQQQQDALAAGADVALLKGFPAAELLAIIAELLTEWAAENEQYWAYLAPADPGDRLDVTNRGQ